MGTTKKLIASGVAAATLATGGLTFAALNPLASAGAQEQAEPPAQVGARHPHHHRRKLVRFVAFTSEILFSASNTDDYVPPRVRRALLGQRP